MGSTQLIVFLNYINTWQNESDANIDALISELNMFGSLSDFSSDKYIDDEINKLIDIVKDVRNKTIAADSLAVVSDVAAISAFYSFGLSMIVFSITAASDFGLKYDIGNESKELMEKLNTIDIDIADKIGSDVKDYIVKYKSNNNLIASKAPVGMDGASCRAILFQFMSLLKTLDTLDAATFRKYSGSAGVLYNSNELQKIMIALDSLNLSKDPEPDLDPLINSLTTSFSVASFMLPFIQLLSLSIAANSLKNSPRAYKKLIDEVNKVTPENNIDTKTDKGTQTDDSTKTDAQGEPNEGLNPKVEDKPADGSNTVSNEPVEPKNVEGLPVETEPLTVPKNSDAPGTTVETTPKVTAEAPMSFRVATLYGKMAFAVAAVVSVCDIVLEILDIKDAVERYNQFSDKLNVEIRGHYKDYYNGIKEASKGYQEATKSEKN